MKTKSGLSIGISLPQSFPQGRIDHRELRACVRRAEELGYEDAWFTEGILSANFVAEPLTTIAHLAALTERLRFGVAVIILVIAAAVARVLTDVLRPMLGAVEGGDWIARAAGVAVLVIGVFAALDELQIAPAIVVGLFYALLAVIVGSLIVAFGGGGIPVAREYLQRWRVRGEAKAAEIRSNVNTEAATEAMERIRPDTP